jgi:hypothetical protein
MWRGVALIRTDVSEEIIVSIRKVERINELGITLQITSNSNYAVASQKTVSSRCFVALGVHRGMLLERTFAR